MIDITLFNLEGSFIFCKFRELIKIINMRTITSEKLTIVGAAGMIGSNMAQSAILMGLSNNICLYDPYAKGLVGVAEELLQCGNSWICPIRAEK